MNYWEKFCPTFLEALGEEAENLALLRQKDYSRKCDEYVQDGFNPFEAHQMAQAETIYQPTAEADRSWTRNQLNLFAIDPEDE